MLNRKESNEHIHNVNDDEDESQDDEEEVAESSNGIETTYNDLAIKFNKIVVALINLYEKYFQTGNEASSHGQGDC